MDEGLLAEQDIELQAQLADKGIVKVEDIAPCQLDKRLHFKDDDYEIYQRLLSKA
jgi:hypothetical protein